MKTKWAVLGSGGIAQRRTIPEGIMNAVNAELTAVYDIEPSLNQEVANKFNVKECASEEELFATDCDVVYIATPVDVHCDQAIRAAAAGKHVFCEKPLGVTVLEAEKVVEACKQQNVKLGVGLMMRFHAHHREVLQIIKDDKIGIPVLARAQLSCWFPPMEGAWRQDPLRGGGGSLMDMGSHCIDLLEMFFGRVAKISCSTGNLVHNYRSEDTAVVLLEFENGTKGIVDNLFNIPDESSKNRLEIYGSKGSILAEGTIGQGEAGEMTANLQETITGYDAQQTRSEMKGQNIAPQPVNIYKAEVEAFSQAVTDNTDPPVDGEAGLWSQKVLAAAYESASTGQMMFMA